jgi:hypothetical protein
LQLPFLGKKVVSPMGILFAEEWGKFTRLIGPNFFVVTFFWQGKDEHVYKQSFLLFLGVYVQ